MEPHPTLPTPDAVLAMRDSMLGQMQFARRYTLELLDHVPESLWTVTPPGLSTHFAWQIGHLAMAEYGLMLFRQRGRAEGDLELMPGAFRKKFARGSTPSLDATDQPCKTDMLQQLNKIHEEAIRYVSSMQADVLMEPTDMPYAGYPIKLGALLFCPIHEGIHAGQIGLLRRAHGLDPIR